MKKLTILVLFMSFNAYSMFEYPDIDLTNPYEVCEWYNNYLREKAPDRLPQDFQEICLRSVANVEVYLGDDFKNCTGDAHQMRTSDYERCFKYDAGESCIQRADTNWRLTVEACERADQRSAVQKGVSDAIRSTLSTVESIGTRPTFSIGLELKTTTFDNGLGADSKSSSTQIGRGASGSW